MEFKLMAHVESLPDAGYVAWIDGLKGMVVQADSIEEAYSEILLSLRIKLAYDFGVDLEQLDALSENHARSIMRELTFKEKANGNSKKELNLILA